jgi:hypothetical protein
LKLLRIRQQEVAELNQQLRALESLEAHPADPPPADPPPEQQPALAAGDELKEGGGDLSQGTSEVVLGLMNMRGGGAFIPAPSTAPAPAVASPPVASPARMFQTVLGTTSGTLLGDSWMEDEDNPLSSSGKGDQKKSKMKRKFLKITEAVSAPPPLPSVPEDDDEIWDSQFEERGGRGQGAKANGRLHLVAASASTPASASASASASAPAPASASASASTRILAPAPAPAPVPVSANSPSTANLDSKFPRGSPSSQSDVPTLLDELQVRTLKFADVWSVLESVGWFWTKGRQVGYWMVGKLCMLMVCLCLCL